jgi:murein DD-endopeptidase MepM/ murein hydrolase activator NlpD
LKKLLVLPLICALTLASLTPAADAVSRRDLTARQRALQSQQAQLHYRLAQQRARAQALRAKEAGEVKELTGLQQKLEQTSTELQDSQYRLRRAEYKLTLAQEKLNLAKNQFRSQQHSAASRLRAIFKTRALDNWEALLTSPDMSTFLDRYYYLKKLSEQDASLLDRLDRQRRVIHTQQRQYAQQRQSIARITEVIGSQKIQLADMTEDQSKIVSKIKTERQAAEQAVAQLEADSNQVEAMIRRIIAQRRAIEAAARARNPHYVRPMMGTGRFTYPCAGVVTSGFGYRQHPILNRMIAHHGIDFGSYSGTPIYAADNGEVIYSGWYGGYGQVVIIDHGGDLTTLYGHTSRYIVSTGQRVRKGQLIAYVGSTGLSTGPHLHFEVRKNGTPVNPMMFLR